MTYPSQNPVPPPGGPQPGAPQPTGPQFGPPPTPGAVPEPASPSMPPGSAPGGDNAETPRAAGPSPHPSGIDERGRVQRGKVSAVWTGVIVSALLLIALIIFIAQNSRQVSIHFLGFAGHISLGLALLIAAVGSVLLVAIPGTLRIVQLRRALRKNVNDKH